MLKRLMSLEIQELLFDRLFFIQSNLQSKNILPEHILYAILYFQDYSNYDKLLMLDPNSKKKLLAKVEKFIIDYEYNDNSKLFSARLNNVIETALDYVHREKKELLEIIDILYSLSVEKDSFFKSYVEKSGISFNKNDKKKVKNDKVDFNDTKNNQFLSKYTKNLTELAVAGEIDPIVGRENELDRVIQVLSRRKKNNPILVGEPGIGKTALVEGLALKIASNDVPTNLANTKILNLDLTSMVAGTKYRGEFEERLKKLISIVLADKDIILFIDEIHTLIGAGSPEGGMDAANILKPALSRGEFQCIGATTLSEYRKRIEKDSALERRFQMILVDEPNEIETIEILNGVREKFESFHNIKYSNQAIIDAVKLSSRFITDRFQPDKAIDIIDEAGSAMKVISFDKPKNIVALESKIAEMSAKKLDYVKKQDYEKAANCRDLINGTKKKLEIANNRWITDRDANIKVVDEQVIRKVLSTLTGIPVDKIEQAESQKLVNLEKDINSAVIGQTEAVKSIASSIRKSRMGLNSPNRPLGSFLFLGPTGVGKTHLAKTLALNLFGSEDALIRIDMSDYMEKFNVSKLIGSPPGYVGFENGGYLTEKIRRKPYSVVLFDEIEKAHPSVFNVLLQALEEGEIVDSLGHKVSFRNCVVIMTSNLGANELSKDSLGFDKVEGYKEYSEIRESALKEMRKFLSPEFINRIDDIIVFKSLEKKSITSIFDILFKETKIRFQNIGIKISITDEAKKYLIDRDFSYKYGARVVRRAIAKDIEDEISYKILTKKNIKSVEVIVENGNLDYKFN